MSLHEYLASQEISAEDPPFYALIMAAFRKADWTNLEKLRKAFPVTWLEYGGRYNAPGGRLAEELLEQVVEELPKTILGRTVTVKEVGPRHVNLVLGGFDFYDQRKKEEEGRKEILKALAAEYEIMEEQDGTQDTSD